mmetsp:Transcript_3168/g.12739  ORF Transcript_3168/g.12739 Transcript_3168/m.12739 type:complete len:280 (-) Transcript_3168:35-874(-)
MAFHPLHNVRGGGGLREEVDELSVRPDEVHDDAVIHEVVVLVHVVGFVVVHSVHFRRVEALVRRAREKHDSSVKVRRVLLELQQRVALRIHADVQRLNLLRRLAEAVQNVAHLHELGRADVGAAAEAKVDQQVLAQVVLVRHGPAAHLHQREWSAQRGLPDDLLLRNGLPGLALLLTEVVPVQAAAHERRDAQTQPCDRGRGGLERHLLDGQSLRNVHLPASACGIRRRFAGLRWTLCCGGGSLLAEQSSRRQRSAAKSPDTSERPEAEVRGRHCEMRR